VLVNVSVFSSNVMDLTARIGSYISGDQAADAWSVLVAEAMICSSLSTEVRAITM
jgi:hypothetical protein